MKRLLSLLLILALLLMQAPFALAADSAQAVTLRLEAIEGKVSLHNQRKKALTCRAGMKLLSGYTISTEAASYAYVSLDKDKAIKLDGLSTASIQKKGRKLELLLSSGKIFFNIKVPLKADETMELRTSTMVTGIRGTAGVLECLSPDKSQLLLLSGQVEVSSYHPGSGQTESVSIHAGQRATFIAHKGTDKPEVLVAELTPADIPASVATEIAQDPALQTAISEQSKLSLNAVLKQADGLTSEKSAQAEVQKKSENEQKQQKQTESAANAPLDESSGSGSSGGGGVTPEPPVPEPPDPEPPKPEPPDPEPPKPEPPDPEPPKPEPPDPEPPKPEPPDPEPPDPPHSDTTTLDDTKDAKQINQAFQQFKTVQLRGTCNTTVPLSIPANKTLRLLSGAEFSANTNGSLAIQGTLSVDTGAQLKSKSSITLKSGTLDNAGTLSLNGSGGIIIQSGKLNNTGSLVLNDSAALTSSSEAANILKLRNSGTLHIEKQASLICNAPFENSGTISSSGGFFLTRHLTNSGTVPALSMTYHNLDDDDDDDRQRTSTIYANNLSELLTIVPDDGVLTLTSAVSSELIGSEPTVPKNKTLILNATTYQLDLGETTLYNHGTLILQGTGTNDHMIGTGTTALLYNSGMLKLQHWNMRTTQTALASVGGSLHIDGSTISSESMLIATGYALNIDKNTHFSFRNNPVIRAKSTDTVFANAFPAGASVTNYDNTWFHMVLPNE